MRSKVRDFCCIFCPSLLMYTCLVALEILEPIWTWASVIVEILPDQVRSGQNVRDYDKRRLDLRGLWLEAAIRELLTGVGLKALLFSLMNPDLQLPRRRGAKVPEVLQLHQAGHRLLWRASPAAVLRLPEGGFPGRRPAPRHGHVALGQTGQHARPARPCEVFKVPGQQGASCRGPVHEDHGLGQRHRRARSLRRRLRWGRWEVCSYGGVAEGTGDVGGEWAGVDVPAVNHVVLWGWSHFPSLFCCGRVLGVSAPGNCYFFSFFFCWLIFFSFCSCCGHFFVRCGYLILWFFFLFLFFVGWSSSFSFLSCCGHFLVRYEFLWTVTFLYVYFVVVFFCWLIFFPSCFYAVTFFVHCEYLWTVSFLLWHFFSTGDEESVHFFFSIGSVTWGVKQAALTSRDWASCCDGHMCCSVGTFFLFLFLVLTLKLSFWTRALNCWRQWQTVLFS